MSSAASKVVVGTVGGTLKGPMFRSSLKHVDGQFLAAMHDRMNQFPIDVDVSGQKTFRAPKLKGAGINRVVSLLRDIAIQPEMRMRVWKQGLYWQDDMQVWKRISGQQAMTVLINGSACGHVPAVAMTVPSAAFWRSSRLAECIQEGLAKIGAVIEGKPGLRKSVLDESYDETPAVGAAVPRDANRTRRTFDGIQDAVAAVLAPFRRLDMHGDSDRAALVGLIAIACSIEHWSDPLPAGVLIGKVPEDAARGATTAGSGKSVTVNALALLATRGKDARQPEDTVKATPPSADPDPAKAWDDAMGAVLRMHSETGRLPSVLMLEEVSGPMPLIHKGMHEAISSGALNGKVFGGTVRDRVQGETPWVLIAGNDVRFDKQGDMNRRTLRVYLKPQVGDWLDLEQPHKHLAVAANRYVVEDAIAYLFKAAKECPPAQLEHRQFLPDEVRRLLTLVCNAMDWPLPSHPNDCGDGADDPEWMYVEAQSRQTAIELGWLGTPVQSAKFYAQVRPRLLRGGTKRSYPDAYIRGMLTQAGEDRAVFGRTKAGRTVTILPEDNEMNVMADGIAETFN